MRAITFTLHIHAGARREITFLIHKKTSYGDATRGITLYRNVQINHDADTLAEPYK